MQNITRKCSSANNRKNNRRLIGAFRVLSADMQIHVVLKFEFRLIESEKTAWNEGLSGDFS